MDPNIQNFLIVFCLLVPIYFFLILFSVKRAYSLSSVDRRISHQIVFQLLIVIVFLLRMVSLLLQLLGDLSNKSNYYNPSFFISTTASCLFIGSFLTLTFSFLQMYFMKNNTSSERAKKLTILFGILLSLYVIILFVVVVLFERKKVSNYQSKIQMIISCGYTITGIFLVLSTFKFVRSYPKTLQRIEMINISKLWFIVFFCTIMFFIRIALIIVEITNDNFKNFSHKEGSLISSIFLFFGYFLSEQVPAFLITIFVYKRPLKKSEYNENINWKAENLKLLNANLNQFRENLIINSTGWKGQEYLKIIRYNNNINKQQKYLKWKGSTSILKLRNFTNYLNRYSYVYDKNKTKNKILQLMQKIFKPRYR
ncbi:tobamovirus multiplication protein 1-like isoform x1 [Anaeramoeba flamelloides]|uniref:Tobamovirus multiplication protein 1-like isoform x1 n=1 Tax=Anaeramoeba flamelloides TaxID=1746091 RepID=A0AAV7YPN6_9EUKA|nr:tobamovirus multiplication protein 1-like isoform x1 [Anaeramoeba flamelloides]